MVSNIIFISGVHGAGKTTLCKNIYDNLNINYYTCSELIKRIDDKALDSSSKNINDINRNQDILLKSLNMNVNEKNILLDGHFCLIDKMGRISKMPMNIFINLPISLIVVVTRNPEDIVHSLLGRDNKNYDVKFIQSFQDQEVSYAKDVANLLNIEFIEYDYNSPTDILNKSINEKII
jgi:adenylate kinase